MKKLSVLLAAAMFIFSFSAFAAENEPQDNLPAEIAAETVVQPEMIDASVVINGTPVTYTASAVLKNGVFFVPFAETAKALEVSYTTYDGAHKAYTPSRSLIIDSLYNAYINKVLQIPEAAPEIISGKLYVPVTLFVSTFNMQYIADTAAEKPTAYLATGSVVTSSPSSAPTAIAATPEANAAYVNAAGLASDTYYLIWISKSDFSVRVFLGNKGEWEQINSFTCAIGAPGSPTCEGTYKYYQAQSRWDFKSYYVGPIMRFNGGYAMHSTLLYPDGSPKDDRVGMRLSHGCVRLHPEDINWLFYYVPVGTTIHITA